MSCQDLCEIQKEQIESPSYGTEKTLAGVPAGHAIHESAMYPGSIQECSH